MSQLDLKEVGENDVNYCIITSTNLLKNA